jgi:hypothetical protein
MCCEATASRKMRGGRKGKFASLGILKLCIGDQLASIGYCSLSTPVMNEDKADLFSPLDADVNVPEYLCVCVCVCVFMIHFSGVSLLEAEPGVPQNRG